MPLAKPLTWRVQSGQDGGFDELVVRSRSNTGPSLIHAEMMNERAIFVSIGELKVWAHVDRKGVASVTMVEDGAGWYTADAARLEKTRAKARKRAAKQRQSVSSSEKK